MARPRQSTPTAGELEILHVLWDRGPCTVRQVREALSVARPRAYTSVMTLMSVMHEKALVSREEDRRAFVYRARHKRERTLGQMLGQLLSKAFGGSAAALVKQMLEQHTPTPQELEEISRAIEAHQRREGGGSTAAATADVPPPHVQQAPLPVAVRSVSPQAPAGDSAAPQPCGSPAHRTPGGSGGPVPGMARGVHRAR